MLPWNTMIQLQKQIAIPVYLQLANAIIREIKNGIIKPGMKMPGTRTMSQIFMINRQTVVNTYGELEAQGWVQLNKSQGTFVNHSLPEFHPKKIGNFSGQLSFPVKTGYSIRKNDLIHEPAKPNRHITGFHDGPDVRLIPAELISVAYKSILGRKSGLQLLSYVDVEGKQFVRHAISEYLNTTRGLQTKFENILVTRGAQMAMYLLANVLISKNDYVVIADLSFRYADVCFLNAGARLIRIPVDEEGIDVEMLEKICRTKKIRAIYVTSHHHYPTTVTLSAARRMRLIHLAIEHGFIIIEDDYDYEFHYESSPILPLASVDKEGMVIYIGSFSKTISPAIRIGYIAAPSNLINECAKLRMIIDTQGDPVMEQAVGEMLNDGQIRRHMKKSLKIYKERRDNICTLLNEKLSDVIKFKIPEGGLSIWAKFDKKISVPKLSEQLIKNDIILSKGLIHDLASGKKLNCTRMGFGWMNADETKSCINIMEQLIRHQ